jgi:L-threonylcarbamoyladenylate synthase
MHEIIAPTDGNLVFSARMLASGELVAFPTETVYGLAGNAYNDAAVAKVFVYKNRSEFNPLSVCYRSLEEVGADLVVTDDAVLLSRHFLPGPITILLARKPSSKLSLLCSAGTNVVGVRIPSNRVAMKLLSAVSFPLTAPSANRSAKLSPTTAQMASESLKDNEKLIILDGGQCDVGIESTGVDCSGEKPRIVRPGAISKQQISEKCHFVFDDDDAFRKNPHNRSLGHSGNFFYCTKEIVMNATKADASDALLAFGEPFENRCRHVMNLSVGRDLEEAAANFFSMLHELDKTDLARICVMPIPNIGIGQAINDRLRKAAAANSDKRP